MNKHLLLGSALLVAMSAYPQNGRHGKPTGILETKPFKFNQIEQASQSSVLNTPSKQILPASNSSKISVVTATRFTGSMNAFGYIYGDQKPLSYNGAINTIAFIHRKSPTYVVSANGNSGSIVAMISTNVGTSWDSTCIWANGTNLARYPQGGIYNPAGNTNKNNAYVVGAGMITGGSGWLGSWYASKTLNGAGTNAPGTDQQAHLNATPTIKKHDASRYSFCTVDGGLVRSMAQVVNDPNGTTNSGYGLRGGAMVKGQFTAGAFVWSVDSFIPATTWNTSGTPVTSDDYKNVSRPLQAWSINGQTGYVVIIGSRATETINATHISTKGGMQPIVYKTTNFGTSWSLLPANDFANPTTFRGVNDRLYPIETSSTTLIANFAINEGHDAIVDLNSNLHIATTILGHSSNHIDSLWYAYRFGTEQYNYRSANFDWPIIYDFYTTTSGGWNYHMVDSMYSEGPGQSSGDPGFGSNPWLNGTDRVGYDARIQLSRTVDGKKIMYSWAASDTSLLGTKWNVFPNIIMRGYDVTIDKVCQHDTITKGVLNVDQLAYFHYMSSTAVGSSSACIEVPFTSIWASGTDGLTPVNTYYIKGAQACATSFSINPMRPVGINESAMNSNSTIDVLNYPNPAIDATTILVGLKDASAFEIAIYNAVGQVIDTYRVNGHMGTNEVHIDLSNFASGVYVYNVKVGNSVISKKLIVQ